MTKVRIPSNGGVHIHVRVGGGDGGGADVWDNQLHTYAYSYVDSRSQMGIWMTTRSP